ncbi:MAG: 1,4-alpha-glucan branching protein GlgB [Pseudomonadota bacterium]
MPDKKPTATPPAPDRGPDRGPDPGAARATIDPLEAIALAGGDHGDPFRLLGPHEVPGGWVIRALVPGAEAVEAIGADSAVLATLAPAGAPDLFEGPAGAVRPGAYTLRARRGSERWETGDPYRFGPVLGELDEHLLAEGSHLELWQVLGAHPMVHEGTEGTHFALWAPNAKRVSVVGDMNHWNGRAHPMRSRGSTGIWEIFLPGVAEGARYKYEIKTQAGAIMPLKADPVGFGAEHPPATASIVRALDRRDWQDGDWMENRRAAHRPDAPISIYEVHLASWRRRHDEGNRPLSYWEHANELIPYVKDMGFTHIELMPITEHPFDGSWGYQPVGLYAPTIRHGTPSEFRDLVEAAHAAGIGLILDWVPGHFPTDAHGLGNFDGTPLYEHADPREGFHRDWSTLIFNYGRREVQNYLIANAVYWTREFHLDGLRVDAVASMLYRDYSREAHDWVPNVHGGRENLEAIAFLKRMNEAVYGADDSVMTVAEESTAWPGVSRPTNHGGLGFGYKWNMGWMNDTLDYIGREPVHRRHHHHQMTFGLIYAFSENFILPLSHDEVVHGKGSILGRMPGNEADRFANLRAYYGFMWGHPGKKLMFMGQEFAQGTEWNHSEALPWHLLDYPHHKGVQALVRDLNRLYRETPALHFGDCHPGGFAWLEASAEDISVYAWERWAPDHPPVIVVCNFTPVERTSYRLGVPAPGHWRERLNTDATPYGGSGRGNLGGVQSQPTASHGRDHAIEITLPPLSTVIFELAQP